MKRKYYAKRIKKSFLKCMLYSAIFVSGVYVGHRCDISPLRDYSISDVEKKIGKTEKKVEHKKDNSLDWLVDKINRLK